MFFNYTIDDTMQNQLRDNDNKGTKLKIDNWVVILSLSITPKTNKLSSFDVFEVICQASVSARYCSTNVFFKSKQFFKGNTFEQIAASFVS